jgi:hypothetical protein
VFLIVFARICPTRQKPELKWFNSNSTIVEQSLGSSIVIGGTTIPNPIHLSGVFVFDTNHFLAL